MNFPARSAVSRRSLCICRAALIAFAGAISAPMQAGAADGKILVELNSAHTAAGACHTSFSVRNGLAHTLDRFQLDLHVLAGDETLKARTRVDLAPLNSRKITTFTFRIFAEPCDSVAKILVNDIPKCRAGSGAALDCVAHLNVRSRARIGLTR